VSASSVRSPSPRGPVSLWAFTRQWKPSRLPSHMCHTKGRCWKSLQCSSKNLSRSQSSSEPMDFLPSPATARNSRSLAADQFEPKETERRPRTRSAADRFPLAADRQTIPSSSAKSLSASQRATHSRASSARFISALISGGHW